MVVGRELLICIGTYLEDEETNTTSHFYIGVTIVGTSVQIQIAPISTQLRDSGQGRLIGSGIC